MNYTPKPSSRITPSIGENRMKIRPVDFESIGDTHTHTHTHIHFYIYRLAAARPAFGLGYKYEILKWTKYSKFFQLCNRASLILVRFCCSLDSLSRVISKFFVICCLSLSRYWFDSLSGVISKLLVICCCLSLSRCCLDFISGVISKLLVICCLSLSRCCLQDNPLKNAKRWDWCYFDRIRISGIWT